MLSTAASKWRSLSAVPGRRTESPRRRRTGRNRPRVEGLEARRLLAAVLQDNFNDNALDTSKWAADTSFSGAGGVVEQGQRIELRNRGYLETAAQYDPLLTGPLRITGRWTFTNATAPSHDAMQIHTRSDGVPTGTLGAMRNGIEFELNGNDYLTISEVVNGNETALTRSIPVRVDNNDVFDFEIRDDGQNLSFTVREVGGQAEVVTITATSSRNYPTDLVVFHNRENNNSASTLSYLDEVTIATGSAISGQLFYDRNASGVQASSGEPGLAGWTVFLDLDGDGVQDNGSESNHVSADVPKAIPDNNPTPATSTLAVSGLPAFLSDVDVTLSIQHTWDADLNVYLVGPTGMQVELFTGVGGSGDNFQGTTLDDEATAPIGGGAAPFSSRYRPEGLLSALDGTDPNGTWTLRITDGAGSDVGTLTAWSLRITAGASEPTAITGNDGRYAFHDLEAGTYRVRPVLQPGWTATSPAGGTHAVTVDAAQAARGRDFGVDRPRIGGLGTPYGSISSDLSEFMLGEVLVNVVLFESTTATANTETWSRDRIAQVKSEVVEGLTWWEDTLDSLNTAHDLDFLIDFTFADNPVPTGREPIAGPYTDQGLWIDDFLNTVGANTASDYFADMDSYDHGRRVAAGTDWATTIFIVDSLADTDGMFSNSYFAYAYLGGPFLVMTYDNDGWSINDMGKVLAHEMGHVFYALDEYPGSRSYTERSGYYNTQNLNAADNHPNPATRVDSIMAEAERQNRAYPAHLASPTARAMLGWRDSDNDGIFDLLDVPLTLSGSGSYEAANNTFVFTGSSSVQTLTNLNPNGNSRDLTINTVDAVQYRLNGGSWTTFGTFEAYSIPSFTRSITGFAAGTHTIQIRTIDADTGVSSNIIQSTFTVAPSGPTDVRLVSATTAGGGTMTITYEVHTVAAAPFQVGFYLSADTTFGGDSLLNSLTISSPADLTVGRHTLSFTLGTDAGQLALPGSGLADPDADYHLLVVADHLDAVTEDDVTPFAEDNTVVFAGAYATAAGPVVVHGGAGADTISIGLVGGNLQVTLNGSTYSYAQGKAARIRAHGGGDTITLGSDIGARIAIWAGDGDDTITTGVGPYLGAINVLGGPGTDTLSAGAVAALTFDGGAGADVATVGGLAAAERFLLSPGGARVHDGTTERQILSDVATITIQAGPEDQAILNGGADEDDLIARPGSATLTGPDYVLSVTGSNSIEAYAGAGTGQDADIYDSAGDDIFEAWDRDMSQGGASSLRVSATGYDALAVGFSQHRGHATGGGTDEARLSNTSVAHILVARPGLTTQSYPGYGASAAGFEVVISLSSHLTGEVAELYDSAGADVLETDLVGARLLYADGTSVRTSTYGTVRVHSTAGGADRVEGSDAPGNDRLVVRPGEAYLTNMDSAFTHSFYGFADINVDASVATGDSDVAELHGSTAADLLTASPAEAVLAGTGFKFTATGFRRVEVDGATGADTAELTDSTGADTWTASPTAATLAGPGFEIVLSGFENATATASAGGGDVAHLIGAADVAPNRFTAYPDRATFTGPGYSFAAVGFVQVGGTAVHTATTAQLYGSDGDDTFSAQPTLTSLTATLSGPGFSLSVGGFLQVAASAGAAGFDSATLSDSPLSDSFTASPNGASLLTGTAYSVVTSGFDRVTANASDEGYDTITLSDSPGMDAFTATPATSTLLGPSLNVTANGFNEVTVSGTDQDVADLTGSILADTFTATPTRAALAGSGFRLVANGFGRVTTTGVAGNDQATLDDSAGNDTFTATPTTATLSGPSYQHTVNGFRAVTARATAGGADTANLYDSPGDDAFTATPAAAVLSGAGYRNEAAGFDRVDAHATAGGTDAATLDGSAGSDSFVATPVLGYLLGAGFANYARAFDVVTGRATAGGVDAAVLFDSAGDDAFTASPTTAVLSGTGYRNEAAGFGRVDAYATAGGTDAAELADSAGNDAFIATPAVGYLLGTGFANYARSFDRVTARATAGGADTANLYDSPGDDAFTASPAAAVLSGVGYRNEAAGFDRVDAHATAGGTDAATLDGSAGDDGFVAAPGYAVLRGVGYYNYAKAFDRVTARAGVGGVDAAWLYDSPGDDAFTASPTTAVLSGTGYRNEAAGFGRVDAYATAGGTDAAELADSAGNDAFIATPAVGYLLGTGFANYARSFDRVTARATAGGADTANLYDSPGDDAFTASPAAAVLSGVGYRNEAAGFDRVDAHATAGGTDAATLDGSADSDTFTGLPTVGYLAGAGFANYARSFNRVTAYAGAGADRANFYDSPGDDTFTADPAAAVLAGPGYRHEAVGFDQAHAYATAGGVDTATLDGSPGDDTFTADPAAALLAGPGYFSYARGFDAVTARAGSGGVDVAYLYDSDGDDRFDGAGDAATLSGAGYANAAEGFGRVRLDGTRGGRNARRLLAVDYLLDQYGTWVDE